MTTSELADTIGAYHPGQHCKRFTVVICHTYIVFHHLRHEQKNENNRGELYTSCCQLVPFVRRHGVRVHKLR